MFLRPKILRSLAIIKSVRTFLSEEYRCTTEWNSRLSAPFMEKIKLENFYYEIDQSFHQQGRANAIDIDIFVNKATSAPESHIDEISNLLHRLRLTEETSNMLQSTGHAFVRNLVDLEHIPELLNILDNRLTYGVFLDDYIAIYALNSLIKKNDFHSAARIATFVMLQEEFSNPIVRSMATYASYKYLEKCEPFYEAKEPEVDVGKNKKEEIIKVRVGFLRNEFFDDHFDLKNNKHLIGKTLASIGEASSPDQIGLNLRLLGYTLYEKFDKSLSILQSSNTVFYKDIIAHCLESIKSIEDGTTSFNNLKSSLENIYASNKLDSTNVENALKNIVEKCVKEHETSLIQKQKEVYNSWNEIRTKKLNEELERFQRVKRLQQLETISIDMQKKEQKLWFFENEDNIDLQIDSKKVTYPKRWFGKLKKPRVVDESYIPPEITKHRN